MFLKNNIALVTAYIDDATYSEEEKYFLNVEYFSNENENGIENFGVRFDYYTDVSIPEQQEDGSFGEKYIYSSGVQFKNGYSYNLGLNTNGISYFYGKYTMKNCKFYNSDSSNISFSATNSLKDMNHWVYDIDGQLCLIEEKGNVKEGMSLWAKTGTCYNTDYLIKDLYDVAKSLPDGESVVLLDLSKFFNVYLYNGKEFDKSTPCTAENLVFVQCYINKTSDGLVSAKQSMFGCYMGDSEWSLYSDEQHGDFWKVKSDYYLKLNEFTIDIEEGKYYLKLQSSVIDYLKNYKNIELYVNLDLDNIYLGEVKLNILGFSKNCFADLEVAEIILKSSEKRNFYVYEDYNFIEHENITIRRLEVANA